MKFHVQNLSKRAPRVGVLKDIENKPSIKIQTPVVLLHTQGGHIPHITHEVFKLVSKEPQILQIPLVSMHIYRETIGYYNGTLSEFIGNKDSITCLTLHDPTNLSIQGHNVKEQVPIWTKQGKILYNPESYMNMVESFKPDMYYLLSDSDTNRSSSHKRLSKSVENTLFFYKQCLERQKNSDILKNSFVMAPVVGGYCLKSRQKYLDGILKDHEHISGYLIDGLHNNGPEVEFLPFEELHSVIEFVINNLPPECVRSVQGCWNPVNVIKLVKLGVDMFDTSYCHVLTERSAAMTFAIGNSDDSTNFEINLRNSKYVDDFQPILNGCKCLTCTKYSKGYIHHLLTVQELLGPILIMIHNIHHYLRFFEMIRRSIKEETLDELEVRIFEQFEYYQKNMEKKTDAVIEVVRRNNALGDVQNL